MQRYDGQELKPLVLGHGQTGLSLMAQRLTFPFPFVHLQPLDCKLEQLLTVETKSHGSTGCSSGGCRPYGKVES